MHLGKEIQRYMKENSISVTWLADAMNCHRQNVYKIFSRNDMDTRLLWRLSVLLKHDFFLDLSKSLENCTRFGDMSPNQVHQDEDSLKK